MPIQFACPQCKAVLKVDSKLAGKTGKCKCGSAVKVPTPKSTNRAPVAATAGPKQATRPQAPVQQPNPLASSPTAGLAGMFDELTESDYNRQSPYQNVYAPPKVQSTDNALLKKAAEEERGSVAQPGKLNGTLIFIAVINILEGIACFGLAGILVLGAAMLSDVLDQIPYGRAGTALLAGFCSVLGVIALGCGIGLLTKQKWGWFLACSTYTAAGIDRAVGLVVAIMYGQGIVGAVIGLLISVSLNAFLYSEDTRKIYKVKGNKLAIIAASLGVVVAVSMFGVALALGVLTPESQN